MRFIGEKKKNNNGMGILILHFFSENLMSLQDSLVKNEYHRKSLKYN